MSNNTQDTVRRLLSAIAEFDTSALTALLTPDAAIVFPGRPVYYGPLGAEQFINDLARTYVNWKPAALRVVGDESTTTAEWTSTITDFGGAECRLDGCAVVDFHGEKVHRCRIYCRPEDTQQ